MHEESLRQIPLVRHLWADARVRLEPRSVDRRWHYAGHVRASVSGFNPFLGRVFYPSESFIARWLTDPDASARPLNEGDYLVREVLFAVHDYLHVWSLYLLNGLRPGLAIGVAPITRENVDDLVFMHLVTEAAATVGLDYWYLSTVELGKVVPIGTAVEGLTVTYHERFADEYRRFNPSFVVQDRSFFAKIVRFYCSGVFEGFDVSDLRRSARVLKWLKHELRYGVQQRRYIRQWLSYLSGGRVTFTDAELAAPVEAEEGWRRTVVEAVGEGLWAKVKRDELVAEGRVIADAEVWRADETQRPDFRFLNANVVEPSRAEGLCRWDNADENFRMYLSQLVSRVDYAACDPILKALLPSLFHRKDIRLAQRLVQAQPSLPHLPEWADLLILN